MRPVIKSTWVLQIHKKIKQSLRQEINIHSQGSTVIMKHALKFTSLFLFIFSCHAYAGDVAGKSTYDSICVACHGSGLPGIPQLGDGAAWASRIEQGNDMLYKNAISGFTGSSGIPMPAKGGNPAISDDDVKAAVDYMVANSQGDATVATSQKGAMPPAGNEKTKICATCHGVDGNSVNPVWPKLAGQHAEYIFKQLKDFNSGARKNIQMSPLAAPLSVEDMQDIATYFSSQKIKIGYASAETLPLGEHIYRAGDASKGLPACMACHGPSGAGNSAASFPALSGQHAEYTKIQLLAFRDNKRTNDTNKAMQIVSEKMTTEEIDAVANYIQGLH